MAQPLAARSRYGNRDISDWVGALFFIGGAATVFWHTSQFSILLLPILAHEILAASSFLIWRTAPKRQFIAWPARAAAYISSFAFPVLVTLAEMWRPNWLASNPNSHLRLIGGCLWIYGSMFGLWALWSLRRSFSIEPVARELRTGGPYKIARHPIYSSYILQYTGILLARPSVLIALVYVFWFVMMIVRARIEEGVLESAFPAYKAYRQEVGMFCPRFFRRASKRQLHTSLGDMHVSFAASEVEQEEMTA